MRYALSSCSPAISVSLPLSGQEAASKWRNLRDKYRHLYKRKTNAVQSGQDYKVVWNLYDQMEEFFKFEDTPGSNKSAKPPLPKPPIEMGFPAELAERPCEKLCQMGASDIKADLDSDE